MNPVKRDAVAARVTRRVALRAIERAGQGELKRRRRRDERIGGEYVRS
jgi:hypothetical protein